MHRCSLYNRYAMNNYTQNDYTQGKTNSMYCYGVENVENAGYEALSMTREDIKLLEELSVGFANSAYPFNVEKLP